jgi:hypothetical protein
VLVNHTAGFTNFLLPESLEVSAKPLQKAVDALMLLDNGNRMVERCASFLDRLGQLLSSLSRSSPILHDLATITDTYPASHSLNSLTYPSVLPEGVTPGIPLFQGNGMPIPPQMNLQQQSPLGMDLGEFMMESDLDFLNYFTIPPSVPNGVMMENHIA